MISDRETQTAAEAELVETAKLLAGIEIFRSLSEMDFKILAAVTGHDTMMPGESITCGDEHATDIYIIERGEVEISDRTFVAEDHVHTEPHLLGPGDVIVWSAIIEHTDYVAATDLAVRKIPGPKLLEFLRTRPEAGIEVMAEIATAARLRREAARAHGANHRVTCPLCPSDM